MGLFDEIAGQVAGQVKGELAGELGGVAQSALGGATGGGLESGLVGGVLGMIGGRGGGLQDLVRRFETAGLKEVVGSWVSTGPNLPIAPAQVEQALGGDTIDQLATKQGAGRDAVTDALARVLPGVVDKLTPGGQLPAATAALPSAEDIFGQLFK